MYKNRRIYRLLCSILASCMLLSHLGSLAALETGWRDAYAALLTAQPPLSANEQGAVLLCDLDFDGVPELFWGGTQPGYAEIAQAWTYREGEAQHIALSSPAGSHFFVSDIQSARLLRARDRADFLFLSPTISTHNGNAKQEWGTLTYQRGKLTKNEPIYHIQTGMDADYDAEGNLIAYRYPEIGWSFQGQSLGQEEFDNRLTQYLAGYLDLGKPALWAFENPDALFEPEIPAVKALGNLWTADGWNIPALHRFLSLWTPEIVQGSFLAAPNRAQLEVNGTAVTLPSYLLFGNNYIRLRDAAACLNGTGRKFDVQWNSDQSCVELTTGRAYEGAPLDTLPTTAASAVYSTQIIRLDGADCACTAYLIDGYHYVRLRDLGEALGFAVRWNDAEQKIHIEA